MQAYIFFELQNSQGSCSGRKLTEKVLMVTPDPPGNFGPLGHWLCYCNYKVTVLITVLMLLKRLPISILFHATFALIYLPTIIFSFVFAGWRAGATCLTALIGLGILAALDMLIIRREVNQRAFRVIEIFVIIGLPASAWPVIVSLLSLVPGPLAEYFQNYNSKFWPWKLIDDLKTPGNDVSMAFAITATFAVLAPSAIYILYIYVARLMDELRPQNSHWHPQSSSRTQKKWYFIGAQRAPAERMAVINHCASYIFQKTVFRKHVFEPTGWAILRGVVAVYSCIGILIFSAYSGVAQVQLYTSVPLPDKPVISSSSIAVWKNPVADEVWCTYNYDYTFSVSWNSSVSLVLYMTAASTIGDLQSTQYSFTNPLTLLHSKNYTISLSTVSYILGSFSWVSFELGFIDSVPSGSEQTTAIFSIDPNQQRVTQRVLSAPSVLLSVAHVLSAVGGTFAFIDGLFALIFGRTIMGILLGNRAISPFGLLGIVTRNRFKRLIHEQYPLIQEDIDRGGMAAYISEVAIDAALMDVPPVKGQTSSSLSSHTEHEAGDISMGHLRARSNLSHPELPYIIEEFQGELDNHPLVGRRSDVE
ncbi:hypothetical protein FIBSPDRAFT_936470 [Athelia psychrophila]|uniref:Uncharacterized protein n=1 Tax=Athelia psychrophila TaxID=1759441 RepID=A0A166C1N9_9AGAM|nr:hypothetical protein FIBSPDRAFT_936470 [Fibularhizoctonia sp. CBS 109695]